jgi:hypothetical protein
MSIGTAILIVGVLFALVASAGFRKVGGVLSLLIVIAAAVAGGWIWKLDREKERAQEQADQQKKQAEREAFLENPVPGKELTLGSVVFQDDGVLVGTVTNHARHALGSMTFLVTIIDCLGHLPPKQTPNNGKNCRIIGQETAVVTVDVPPAQTRKFSSGTVTFAGMPGLDQQHSRWSVWRLTDTHPSGY